MGKATAFLHPTCHPSIHTSLILLPLSFTAHILHPFSTHPPSTILTHIHSSSIIHPSSLLPSCHSPLHLSSILRPSIHPSSIYLSIHLIPFFLYHSLLHYLSIHLHSILHSLFFTPIHLPSIHPSSIHPSCLASIYLFTHPPIHLLPSSYLPSTHPSTRPPSSIIHSSVYPLSTHSMLIHSPTSSVQDPVLAGTLTCPSPGKQWKEGSGKAPHREALLAVSSPYPDLMTPSWS